MKHKYQVIEVIGEGAYGIVYKCRDRETDEIVAIKKFKEEYENLPKKGIKREIFALQSLKHENIVKFNEAFLKKDHIYLVFGYCEKSLLQLIEENPKGLNPDLIQSFVYQMCKAISYLHKKNIVHRDIKPENLLIKDDTTIKLCDFGFARKMKYNEKKKIYEKMTEYITTRWYRAPELLLGQGNYGPEIDYWAIGCLMGEMADGNPVFPGDDEINQLECIIKLIGNLPEELVKSYNDNPDFNINKLLNVDKPETLEKRYEKILSPDAIDFMKGLLELSPKKRLNDENIFNHKYFACYRNTENNERNDDTNKLYFSLSIDKRNKIKIPNLNDTSKEEDSKIINIFKYDDDYSYIDEEDENISSDKKLVKNSNSNLDNPLKQQQIKNHFRSDMIDFGKLYMSTENNKVIDKQYNNNKNIFNTESNKYKLIQKKIIHKNPINLIKSQDFTKSPNENKKQDKFPYLSPRFLFEKKIPESKMDKIEYQKINNSSLFNSLKNRNKKLSLFEEKEQNSKKIILSSKFNDSKNELKPVKKGHHSIDFNSINNNNSNLQKRKYFDNSKSNKIIFENKDYIPQKKIINLYENAFKDLISNSKKKEFIHLPKKIDSMKIIYKNNRHNYLSQSHKRINLQLPPIFNFYSNNVALNNNNTNKDCKNILQYNNKIINNVRYKIDNY